MGTREIVPVPLLRKLVLLAAVGGPLVRAFLACPCLEVRDRILRISATVTRTCLPRIGIFSCSHAEQRNFLNADRGDE